MGTIYKVPGKSGVAWRAQLCVDGQRQSRTFSTKQQALQWSLDREAQLSSDPQDIVQGRTFGQAMQKYAEDVSPGKRGARWEQIRLAKLQRDKIAHITCQSLCLDDLEQFRDRSLESLSPGSVIRELTVLKCVARAAVKWKWISAYPFDGIRNPPAPPPRDRLPTQDEIDAIVEISGLNVRVAWTTSKSQEVAVAFLLAIETAMRLGEMISLRRSDLDLENRVAYLRKTKNGDSRAVPLSTRAVELISWLPPNRERLFSVSSDSASVLFRKMWLKAGIVDLTFHDSRHLATTRLAEKLEVLELARVTGHRNINQLLTYYNKSAADLARKIG